MKKQESEIESQIVSEPAIAYIAGKGIRTLQDYESAIKANSSKITQMFAVRTLRIFGSVSRGEQTANSDLDVCVETETPNPFLLMDLKEYLEGMLNCSVDVVRMHKNMNALMRERIEKEGIYAIR